MFERIRNEPALVGGAVTAVLNALVLLGVVSLSVEQITGINVAVAAGLALFVRANVTPTRTLTADERGVMAGVSGLIAVLLAVFLVLGILWLLGVHVRLG